MDAQQQGFDTVMKAMAAATAAHNAAAEGAATAGDTAPQAVHSAAVTNPALPAPVQQQAPATMSRATSLLDELQEPIRMGTVDGASSGHPARERPVPPSHAGGLPQPQQLLQQQLGVPPLQDAAGQPPAAAVPVAKDGHAAVAEGGLATVVLAAPTPAKAELADAAGLGQAASQVPAQPAALASSGAATHPSANGSTAGQQAATPTAVQAAQAPTGVAPGAGSAASAAVTASAPAPPAAATPALQARAAPQPLPPLEKGEMLEAFRCVFMRL